MNATALLPGDILLFRVSNSSNWIDRLIGWGQKVIHQAPTMAAYCHVAMVGPDSGHYYEASWPRIKNTPLILEKIERTIVLEAYRVKGITAPQVASALAFARARMGAWYDFLAILTFGKLQIGPTAVCSQYVYQCFEAAGIVLCKPEILESPDDIAASILLERIG